MKKSTIIIASLVILGALGLMWWGSGNQSPESPQFNANGSLTASEKLFDFGTISMAKGKVSHLFNVANSAGKDVTIKELSTSCMCTAAYIKKGDSRIGPFGMASMGARISANELVRAGETVEIEAEYDPAAHGPAGIGPIDRFITLTESDGGSLQFEIKAQVTP